MRSEEAYQLVCHMRREKVASFSEDIPIELYRRLEFTDSYDEINVVWKLLRPLNLRDVARIKAKEQQRWLST